ncbi:MAG TPA: hypothetical protein PLL76_23210 [Thermoanaerobaculia bacterium]|nr:hypothetical protein [Thermoanaerobaculia bacterium]
MDRDVIERYLQQPGTYLRGVRICGRGVIAASIIYRGDTLATGRGASLAAALDALASELTTRAA